jgi:hypothetical protein
MDAVNIDEAAQTRWTTSADLCGKCFLAMIENCLHDFCINKLI